MFAIDVADRAVRADPVVDFTHELRITVRLVRDDSQWVIKADRLPRLPREGDVRLTAGERFYGYLAVMNPSPVSYKHHRFPPAVIAHAVRLYFRFPLSLRSVEETLLERGINVSYETIRCWAKKFGPNYASRLRRKPPSRSDIWLTVNT